MYRYIKSVNVLYCLPLVTTLQLFETLAYCSEAVAYVVCTVQYAAH